MSHNPHEASLAEIGEHESELREEVEQARITLFEAESKLDGKRREMILFNSDDEAAFKELDTDLKNTQTIWMRARMYFYSVEEEFVRYKTEQASALTYRKMKGEDL